MGSVPVPHLMQKPQPNRGGMRVVVLEPNADYRDELQYGLERMPEFQFVGDSGTWEECLTLLETYLPELLIARTTCVPLRSQTFGCSVEFPVVMGSRIRDSEVLAGAFETIDLPVDTNCLRA